MQEAGASQHLGVSETDVFGGWNKMGVLIFSRNNERDYVCLDLNDFIAILQDKEKSE